MKKLIILFVLSMVIASYCHAQLSRSSGYYYKDNQLINFNLGEPYIDSSSNKNTPIGQNHLYDNIIAGDDDWSEGKIKFLNSYKIHKTIKDCDNIHGCLYHLF